MTIEEYAAIIERSPNREKIETDLQILFNERDVRKIQHINLQTFLEDVLPKLAPEAFEGKSKK